MSTVSDSKRPMVVEYYELMDSGRLAEACAKMTDDIKLTFGNAEPVYGPKAAADAIGYVIGLTDGIEHEVVGFWEFDNGDGTTTAIFELSISYRMKSGQTIVNPGLALGIINADGRFIEQRLHGGLNLAELG